MKNIGGFFFMLGIIVTAFHYWRKDGQTVEQALLEVHKDLVFASSRGIKRMENK